MDGRMGSLPQQEPKRRRKNDTRPPPPRPVRTYNFPSSQPSLVQGELVSTSTGLVGSLDTFTKEEAQVTFPNDVVETFSRKDVNPVEIRTGDYCTIREGDYTGFKGECTFLGDLVVTITKGKTVIEADVTNVAVLRQRELRSTETATGQGGGAMEAEAGMSGGSVKNTEDECFEKIISDTVDTASQDYYTILAMMYFVQEILEELPDGYENIDKEKTETAWNEWKVAVLQDDYSTFRRFFSLKGFLDYVMTSLQEGKYEGKFPDLNPFVEMVSKNSDVKPSDPRLHRNHRKGFRPRYFKQWMKDMEHTKEMMRGQKEEGRTIMGALFADVKVQGDAPNVPQWNSVVDMMKDLVDRQVYYAPQSPPISTFDGEEGYWVRKPQPASPEPE